MSDSERVDSPKLVLGLQSPDNLNMIGDAPAYYGQRFRFLIMCHHVCSNARYVWGPGGSIAGTKCIGVGDY